MRADAVPVEGNRCRGGLNRVDPSAAGTETDQRCRAWRTSAATSKGRSEAISVPSYMVDAAGVIRLNPAAIRLVGDVRGRQYTSVVTPEDTRRARRLFAQKVMGTAEATDSEEVLFDRTGERMTVEIQLRPAQAAWLRDPASSASSPGERARRLRHPTRG